MMSDARILHNYWMDIAYDRHSNPHPVVGEYKPENRNGLIAYYVWSILGIAFVTGAYPISYIGILTKIYCVDNITGFVEDKGITKTLILLGLVWIALSIISYIFQPTQTTYAVIASSIVAMLSAIVSYIIYLTEDNRLRVAVGYPSAYTAILLPPVMFSVLSPIFGEPILEFTSDIVIFLKNNLAVHLGLKEFFTENFDLVGLAHVVLWLNISLIIGWATGFPVQLAKIIRDN